MHLSRECIVAGGLIAFAELTIQQELQVDRERSGIWQRLVRIRHANGVRGEIAAPVSAEFLSPGCRSVIRRLKKGVIPVNRSVASHSSEPFFVADLSAFFTVGSY